MSRSALCLGARNKMNTLVWIVTEEGVILGVCPHGAARCEESGTSVSSFTLDLDHFFRATLHSMAAHLALHNVDNPFANLLRMIGKLLQLLSDPEEMSRILKQIKAALHCGDRRIGTCQHGH